MVIQRRLRSLRASRVPECSTGRDDFFQRSGQDGKPLPLYFVYRGMSESSYPRNGAHLTWLKSQQISTSLQLGTDPLKR